MAYRAVKARFKTTEELEEYLDKMAETGWDLVSHSKFDYTFALIFRKSKDVQVDQD